MKPLGERRFARVRTEIPGPGSRAMHAAEQALMAPGTQAIATLAGLALERGEGALVADVDGNVFIDFVAGLCVASLGHGHPALREALALQAGRLSSGSFTTAPRLELLQRIAAMPPGPGLVRTQLYSGGAEAVEAALRLARAATGHYEVVGFFGGFHGKTGGVLGLLDGRWRGGALAPAGQYLAPYADCYRCPLQLEPASCGLACVDFLRRLIRAQTSGRLAAIVVEPIQGTAGNVIPPPGWLGAVSEVARECGALLIVDEMITGWGRTGSLWAGARMGAAGDIVTFGKGVGGGFPVSGLISRDDIVRAEPWSLPSASSSSYGGGPLAAAAANAVTRVIVEERLWEQAASVGDEMRVALEALMDKYSFIGAVRGQGLLLAVELVRDRRSREPLAQEHCRWLFQECLRRGLLTMAYNPRVRINPPLVITREQACEGIEIFAEACAALARRIGN
ncbi:MAG: aminotransferase class III-fold pyridoxal phosphate-dependent enzyme [Myxococcales bacterium]|nr:aminotransferase class III-fold pyridoxal phosphate-dependent enzyme [Myxococcota bacterium]MDW8283777.1 aminotransferase class III-fold pyridoxal phosphate-dependent enzyme [Myxococcales bacterium]